MKYGIPTYLYLEKETKCVNGSTESSGDRFLLSFSDKDKALVDKVKEEFKIDGKSLQLSKESAINEMVLSLPPR